MAVFTLITNSERGAEIALETGIQRIAIDLEGITKIPRQVGCGTFFSSHSIEDLVRMRARFRSAEIMVRVNSIHDGSREELLHIADSTPQFVMLPFFTTLNEVDIFLSLLPKGSSPILLLESVMSLRLLERLINEYPIPEYFIGLNDLSLDLGNQNFLITLTDPLFVEATERLRNSNRPWGFGGVGNPFDKNLPISTGDFFEFQIAMGSSRFLFSRNFRILFDQLESVKVVGSAFGELCRVAEITSRLETEDRRRLCQRFLDEQVKNKSLNFYSAR